MAGKRKNLDLMPIEERVFRLAKIQCTQEEIAYNLGISIDTLQRNHAASLKKGEAAGRQSLRRAQYKRAMAGSDTMLIWLGKQRLDQKDKQTVTNEYSSWTSEQLEEAIEMKLQRREARRAAK